MRRGLLGLVLACWVLLPGTRALAEGVPSVVSARSAGQYVPGGSDSPVALVMVQGGTLVFVNLDPSNHHTLDFDPPVEISSGELASGQWAVLSGTESLPPGTYAFKCQLHFLLNNMQGTLEVEALP
jgi:plastocyanin